MSVPTMNLLPWRYLRQARQNTSFYRMLKCVLAISIIMIATIYAYHWHQLNRQQAINEDIVRRMSVLDESIDRIAVFDRQQQELLDKAKSINQLRANRVAMVHFIQHLATVSDGLVYLTRISHAGEMLTIFGVSKDTASVSRFAWRLGDETSNDIGADDVLVTSLQQSADGNWVDFVITARLDLDELVLSDSHETQHANGAIQLDVTDATKEMMDHEAVE
ncbi:PilN domain-containing protein [Moraxella oculi]|uniref:PilN domain-containing protein n=1 Tax=Moraxella oculi TaxID=2940516 RepID=A0ABW8U4J7_9GAMM